MEELFLKLGLSHKEAAIYLELVRIGASPVSVWAKNSGVNRSSMYVILERFLAEGLVTTFTHKGVLHAQAIPMADIPALLYDKETMVKNTRDLFIKNLPDLQKLEKTQHIKPKVHFYEGVSRVENMYDQVLKEKSFKAFFHPERVKTIMPEYFHKIPLTLKASGGSAKELLVKSKEAQEYIRLYQSQKHQIALLPHAITFSSDTIITKEKIYLVGYSSTDAVATEIWNEELALTQSTLFDLIWSSVQKKG
ncbi:MAG: helix-turn-helix domain-containing protein [bacterium]|nr:helix-turn-helix domain-containing protein [bacterium]